MKPRIIVLALALASFFCALPAQAQFGRITNGPPSGGCSNPILEFDTAGQDVWNCQNGIHKAISSGMLTGSTGAGSSTVINSSTALNGSSYTLAGGVMNVKGKKLRIYGYGTYSITTGTPTVALQFIIGGVTVATCTSAATTNAASNLPFRFEAIVTTAAIGTSGNDEAHCKLELVLGTVATAATSSYLDNNTAVSSNYDHTINETLTVNGLAAGASNAATLREFGVQILQ